MKRESKSAIVVEQNDHTYRIVKVEGDNNLYNVVRDKTNVKQITEDELFINGDLINIEEWFRQAK